MFSIEIEDQSGSDQSYVPNTAVLKTTLHGDTGTVEITDFCPRFYHRDRTFRPQMLVRQIVPVERQPADQDPAAAALRLRRARRRPSPTAPTTSAMSATT